MSLMAEHAAFERAPDPTASHSTLQSAIFGESPQLNVWFAVVGGDAVGYVSATRDFSTWRGESFLHMDCLYVREPYRKHGLGRRLVERLERFARRSSISELQWQTPVWNTAASSFYFRLGATETIKRRFSYRVGRGLGTPAAK